MRILVVSQYFWPEGFRINDLVKTLVEKDVVVDVLTGKPNYPEGRIYEGYSALGCTVEEWFGAKLYRIPLVPRGSRGAFGLAANYLSFIFFGLLFGPWLLRSRRYDAIFVYGLSPILQAIPALFLGRMKDLPVILWVQDLWPESLKATGYVRNPWILELVARVVSLVYRSSDLVLVQSRAFIPYISSLAPEKQIQYYPNSVDMMFCEGSAGASPKIPGLDSEFPVVFAGNIGAGQAVEVIVETAALLKEHTGISFVVVGQGSKWNWMKEQANLRGLSNLHLPGRYPVNAMPGLMRMAGALLVSLADEPIFSATVPNKLQAYMASGRPILASLNGEGALLVGDAEAGLSAPAGDAQALAVAVLKMYRMPLAERNRMGANGRRYFMQHFDHNTLTEQLIRYLGAAVDAYKGKR